MKRLIIFVLLFSTISPILLGIDKNNIPLLRWMGPEGSKPEGFRDYTLAHPYSEFSWDLHSIASGRKKGATVAILVEKTLEQPLEDAVYLLTANLSAQGYTVQTYTVSGGTPEDLKTFLQGLYTSDSIQGAFFIGDLPVAWFQVEDDFGTYGYAEWPIDLFFMDLNGEWLDTLQYDGATGSLVSGSDSIYDTHTGEINPEIFIGRLVVANIGEDTLLIQNYLRKDNAYRRGEIALLPKALVYVDDDWVAWADYWASNVALLYSDTTVVSDSNTTTAGDYEDRLYLDWAWTSVFAHSWPGGHAFYYNDHANYDYYYADQYTSQNPPCNFYNFFSCSFARYTTTGYGAGRAVLTDSFGVGGVGSTKTGSMLDFEYFYEPLSHGKTLGEAFKDWFTYITEDGVTALELSWHYGMTLIGDPFLIPTGHSAVAPICTLIVENACGASGEQGITVPVSLNNTVPISSVEFCIHFDDTILTPSNITTTPRSSSLAIDYTMGSDTIWVNLSSPSNAILPDTGAIIEVEFDVSSNLTYGDSTSLWLTRCRGQASTGELVYFDRQQGWFFLMEGIANPQIEEQHSYLCPVVSICSDHIRFSWRIDTSTRVKLQIYDASGRLISKILDSYQVPGVYSAVWNTNADNVPSGVYFYRLTTHTHAWTGKIVLIK